MSIVNGCHTLKIKTVHFRLSDLASLDRTFAVRTEATAATAAAVASVVRRARLEAYSASSASTKSCEPASRDTNSAQRLREDATSADQEAEGSKGIASSGGAIHGAKRARKRANRKSQRETVQS